MAGFDNCGGAFRGRAPSVDAVPAGVSSPCASLPLPGGPLRSRPSTLWIDPEDEALAAGCCNSEDDSSDSTSPTACVTDLQPADHFAATGEVDAGAPTVRHRGSQRGRVTAHESAATAAAGAAAGRGLNPDSSCAGSDLYKVDDTCGSLMPEAPPSRVVRPGVDVGRLRGAASSGVCDCNGGSGSAGSGGLLSTAVSQPSLPPPHPERECRCSACGGRGAGAASAPYREREQPRQDVPGEAGEGPVTAGACTAAACQAAAARPHDAKPATVPVSAARLDGSGGEGRRSGADRPPPSTAGGRAWNSGVLDGACSDSGGGAERSAGAGTRSRRPEPSGAGGPAAKRRRTGLGAPAPAPVPAPAAALGTDGRTAADPYRADRPGGHGQDSPAAPAGAPARSVAGAGGAGPGFPSEEPLQTAGGSMTDEDRMGRGWTVAAADGAQDRSSGPGAGSYTADSPVSKLMPSRPPLPPALLLPERRSLSTNSCTGTPVAAATAASKHPPPLQLPSPAPPPQQQPQPQLGPAAEAGSAAAQSLVPSSSPASPWRPACGSRPSSGPDRNSVGPEGTSPSLSGLSLLGLAVSTPVAQSQPFQARWSCPCALCTGRRAATSCGGGPCPPGAGGGGSGATCPPVFSNRSCSDGGVLPTGVGAGYGGMPGHGRYVADPRDFSPATRGPAPGCQSWPDPRDEAVASVISRPGSTATAAAAVGPRSGAREWHPGREPGLGPGASSALYGLPDPAFNRSLSNSAAMPPTPRREGAGPPGPPGPLPARSEAASPTAGQSPTPGAPAPGHAAAGPVRGWALPATPTGCCRASYPSACSPRQPSPLGAACTASAVPTPVTLSGGFCPICHEAQLKMAALQQHQDQQQQRLRPHCQSVPTPVPGLGQQRPAAPPPPSPPSPYAHLVVGAATCRPQVLPQPSQPLPSPRATQPSVPPPPPPLPQSSSAPGSQQLPSCASGPLPSPTVQSPATPSPRGAPHAITISGLHVIPWPVALRPVAQEQSPQSPPQPHVSTAQPIPHPHQPQPQHPPSASPAPVQAPQPPQFALARPNFGGVPQGYRPEGSVPVPAAPVPASYPLAATADISSARGASCRVPNLDSRDLPPPQRPEDRGAASLPRSWLRGQPQPQSPATSPGASSHGCNNSVFANNHAAGGLTVAQPSAHISCQEAGWVPDRSGLGLGLASAPQHATRGRPSFSAPSGGRLSAQPTMAATSAPASTATAATTAVAVAAAGFFAVPAARPGKAASRPLAAPPAVTSPENPTPRPSGSTSPPARQGQQLRLPGALGACSCAQCQSPRVGGGGTGRIPVRSVSNSPTRHGGQQQHQRQQQQERVGGGEATQVATVT